MNAQKCEVTDKKEDKGYDGVIQLEAFISPGSYEKDFQEGFHHPENSALPKEESWIDNGNPGRSVNIMAFNFNKTSGLSQSISGYEVYHHKKGEEVEKTYRTSTINECVEIAKNDIKKCDYYFFSVKNLYTILDEKIVVDGMLCTVLPFSFSSFDEISLRKSSQSVTFIQQSGFIQTIEEHEIIRNKDKEMSSLTMMSLIFTMILIFLLYVIGFLIYRMYKGKRLSVENLRMNQTTAPTIRVIDNNEEDFFVQYKA